MLHSGTLKIHKHLAEAPTLVSELQSFRAQVSDFGLWKFGARSGRHDDLVLAASVALWRAAGDTAFAGWGCFEYYRQQFGTPNTDRELTTLPPPQPPLEPEKPPDFGYSIAPPAVTQVVKLRPPLPVSSASGLSGRWYVPASDGTFRVATEDARPLLAAGWVRVAERWRAP